MTTNIDKKIIAKYYSNKILEYGDTPKGVDWKDKKSQLIRFKSFDHMFFMDEKFSILDYGCGKGDYFIYLKNKYRKIKYNGVDLSKEMVDFAKNKFPKEKNCSFSTKILDINAKSDYCVASGTFTVKHSFSDENWYAYVLSEIDKLYKNVNKGIGFNLMTSHVDFKAKHLFYMNPGKMLKIMIKKYKYVDIIHSYPLYEYTVLIRKK
ncbi:hypothetical protein A2344_02055 [Candidatus Peregrinibacteria bacterium RIFOXYB12_FULL_41_12]|nr:MAG: hypothetical protein A2244_05090 [Candidatus Peregrinibacteria bacterium RIFOXYA2_FULL_41_18]OGJ48767.1 MAG: hypothetical protein A2344_02055 [Candidatus Peregrinibacteria bacterium RIFOXYB12_FULL_41_12]OGJ52438.1 MAG: hypothetical protein A2336_03365 [Candidatus Peregrinibacteria bacterium RIFOXYB2_FULL_41_88]OGJ53113.1 MAG: hypothetical protein A2448_03730 [Candidatus Peregrinibacteria bacterium RIFOXYC2_FULL_41_22]